MNSILKQIKLTNFKCFKEHTIEFDNLSIVIGQNNAGKSTLVEALRILSLSIEKLKRTSAYKNAPDWTGLGRATIGITPKLREIDVLIESDNIFYRYIDMPAIIEANFSNFNDIKIVINKEYNEYKVFACSYHFGINIKRRTQFLGSGIISVNVLPQIVPLLEHEKEVSESTLFGNMFSRKISRNFRTHLFKNKETEEFNTFKNLIEATWSSIQLNEIYKEDEYVYLTVRDKDFTAEIFCMGHGLQMWLQTMWFISWINKDSVVVLDEPDVYMHPDLQRKLIRLLKNWSMQTIIATHSVEIVSDVEPKNIIIINRSESKSTFADNIPAVQAALESMGTVHNLSLSRLLQCKKYIYLEGNDMSILKRFHSKLFPNSKLPIDNIPNTSIGGWGGWAPHKSVASRLKQNLPGSKVFFIFDSDYFSEEVKNQRIKEGNDMGLNVYIFGKKEIENYLLIPSAVARFISNQKNEIDSNKIENEIVCIIEEVCEKLKSTTLDCYIDEFARRHSSIREPSVCRKKVLPSFSKRWEEEKTSMVSGKDALAMLSARCKDTFNVSFGSNSIAAIMLQNEIHEDIINIIEEIENS